MKKRFFCLTAAVLAISMSSIAFADEIQVTVDGTPIEWTDAKPFINADSRTLVPLRPIANALGLSVSWNEEAKQATFSDGVTDVVFTIDSTIYQASNAGGEATVEMDTAAVVAHERTYAPARYLASSFGYEVGWEEAAKTVTIRKAAPAEEDMDIDMEVETEGDSVSLPEVPEGERAAAFPITVEAGGAAKTTIAFSGVTFAEDFDFFTFHETLEIDIELIGKGMEYTYAEDGYFYADLETAIHTAPGEYPLTWTFPAEWFADAPEGVSVSTTLTVTEPSLETAMALAIDAVNMGIFAEDDDTAADLAETILEEANWCLDGSAFTLEVSEGAYDEAGGEWTGTFTVTKGEESLSKEVVIPIQDYEEFMKSFE